MNIERLYETVSYKEGERPRPPERDQFEFVVDRRGRRIINGPFDIGGLLGFGKRETVRVQTNRAFTWTGTPTFPDYSTKLTRHIRCEVTIEGSIEPNENAARSYLNGALELDFIFDSWLKTRIEELFNREAALRAGGMIKALRDPGERGKLEAALLRDLREKVPATRLSLMPVIPDNTRHLDLEDIGQTLEVRFRSRLEVNRVGYKARLKWGDTDEQVLAKLDPQPSEVVWNRAAVEGLQRQTRERFRALLAEALKLEEWSEVVDSSAAVMERVGKYISVILGRETGRVVEDLILYGIGPGDAPESSFSFNHKYAIRGMREEQLEIQHSVRYRMFDRDRWKAQNSPDPKAFIQERVTEATRLVVSQMSLEEIIGLFLQEGKGEKKMGDNIAISVRPQVQYMGYKIVSVITILRIPEMEFVQGRVIVVPESQYRFSDKQLEVPLLVRARVRVQHQEGNSNNRFTRAVAQGQNFEERVREKLAEVVRGAVRKPRVLEYYASSFVNGAPIVGDGPANPVQDGLFEKSIREEVAKALEIEFGLELMEFDLQSRNDRLIERMSELSHLPLNYAINVPFKPLNEEAAITITGRASLFVRGIDPQHWESFYHNARRFDLEQHKNDILSKLDRKLYDVLIRFVTSADRVTQPESLEQIKAGVVEVLRSECGLVVRIEPLTLTVQQPRVADVFGLKLTHLFDELNAIYKELKDLMLAGSVYDNSERITQMRGRAKEIETEIEELSERRLARSARSETIAIGQGPKHEALKDEG